jgi:hypothetical protein
VDVSIYHVKYGIFLFCTSSLFHSSKIVTAHQIDMSLQILFVTDSLKERPSFLAAQGLDDWRQVEMSVAEAERLCEIPTLRGLVYRSPNAQSVVALQEQVSCITFKTCFRRTLNVNSKAGMIVRWRESHKLSVDIMRDQEFIQKAISNPKETVRRYDAIVGGIDPGVLPGFSDS